MDLTISRRSLLGAFGVAAAVGGLGVGLAPRAHGADIYDDLRLRLRATLVGPPGLDVSDPVIAQEAAELADQVDEFLALVDEGADRRGLYTDLNIFDDPDASRVTDTYKRLLPLATAWAVPGHRWSGSAELGAHIVDGMRWMNEHVYTAGRPEYENWWDWELGSVSRIGKVLVIAHDIIPGDLRTAYADAVDWYVTPGYMYPRGDSRHKPATGSNLLNICLGAAIVAIVGRRADRLEQVQLHAPLGLGYTDGSTRDGLYPDGSFLQHDSVPYMGTYGTSFLAAVGDVVALLGDSPWAIDAPGFGELLDGIEAGLIPVIHDGLMPDAFSGREISYSVPSEATRGAGSVFTVIQFAGAADPERRARWLGLARGWIEHSAYVDLSNPTSIGRVPRLQSALAPEVEPLDAPDGAILLPNSDRAVHRGPGWAVSLTLSSERISRFEVTNFENLRPWHQGSGQVATYLRGDVDGQRSNGYWPTVDPFRLPGTTVDSVALDDVDERSMKPLGFGRTGYSAVGAPLPDGGRQRGRYGAVLHPEQGYGSTMRVNQSWFLIEEGVVCLGAGITGGSAAVETVVANVRVPIGAPRGWHADGAGLAGSGEAGYATELTRPAHVRLEGDSGYVFLERPQRLHVIREDREGSWQRIKSSEADVWVTRSYATAWIDHGTDPAGASYAYVLLPGADEAATDAFARSTAVVVDANDAVVQAIHVPRTGFAAANFMGAGQVDAGTHRIAASGPASVSVLAGRGRSATVEIAVADASWGDRPLEVGIGLPGAPSWQLDHADDGVTLTSDRRGFTLALTPTGDGAFRRVLLRRR